MILLVHVTPSCMRLPAAVLCGWMLFVAVMVRRADAEPLLTSFASTFAADVLPTWLHADRAAICSAAAIADVVRIPKGYGSSTKLVKLHADAGVILAGSEVDAATR